MSQKKVLLIGHTETILTEKLTLNKSYDSLTAENNEKWTAKTAAESPDLILPDVVTSGTDVLEACGRIPQHAINSIPSIL